MCPHCSLMLECFSLFEWVNCHLVCELVCAAEENVFDTFMEYCGCAFSWSHKAHTQGGLMDLMFVMMKIRMGKILKDCCW